MANELLVTVPELSLWAYQDATRIPPDEPWALAVLVAASNLVRDTAEHQTDWLSSLSTPNLARIICLRVARRTYLNPDQVVQEGNIGPIGGDRVLDAAALGMELSEQERRDLEGLQGDPTAPGADNGFWVQPLGSDTVTVDPTIYLSDNQQVNLGDLEPWNIPYGHGNDHGAFGDD